MTGDDQTPPYVGEPERPAAPPPTWGPPPVPPPTSSRATTVMVLGVVSVVTFFALCGLGVVPAIIALSMAPGARRELAAAGGRLQGEGQLRTGVILSWVTLGLTALALVAVIAAVALLVAVSDSSAAALAF